MHSPRIFARPRSEPRGLNNELALRYGAATLVTLIALAAAQLVLPTRLMLTLGAITILGVPVALWMRLHEMRVGGFVVPRPLWNTLTVAASVVASAILLRVPLRNIAVAVQGGLSEATILSLGAAEPMLLLVQLFLIFAAFRSLSLISDRDATLATVPSFSVLLLLIPVYPNIEVVCYFLLWTMVATMLFALDYRSELRELVTATVPAPAPGQDVKLAARSLSGVLLFSLVVAVALSGLLTARDPRESSSSDSAISLLASRLGQFTLQTQESSLNSGPERQIDFSSGISLPTRAELWRTETRTREGRAINPAYWRLFTLSNYNGSSWSQTNSYRSVERTTLTSRQWPRLRDGEGYGRGGYGAERFRQFVPNSPEGERGPRLGATGRDDSGFRVYRGFALDDAWPALENDFGYPSEPVRYSVTSTRASLGFVPLLPAPQTLLLFNSEQSTVRARPDGGVDIGVAQPNQAIRAFSRVPRLPEYGFAGQRPPLEKVATPPGAAKTPALSRAERALDLQLPAQLPARVRQFARAATRRAPPNSSNYARALLLAQATRDGAIYTLRPPTIPAGRDATDFFLFESRRGYCTYFAGALTALCRAQNIPARVVTGFVSPEEKGAGRNTIRAANAHAWTEVWVDNWGWAVVDATPGDDRGDNAPTFLENWGDLTASSLDAALRWSARHWTWLMVGGGLILLAFLAWRFRAVIARCLGRQTTEDMEALRRQIVADYRSATRPLERRFRPRQPWETPDEWLQSARQQVSQLPLEPLQTLTALYVRARFSPHQLDPQAAQQARDSRARAVWPKK